MGGVDYRVRVFFLHDTEVPKRKDNDNEGEKKKGEIVGSRSERRCNATRRV